AAERALAGVYLHLAAMHQALGRSPEAERATLQAVNVDEALIVHVPDEHSRFDLAQSLCALGRMRLHRRDPPPPQPPPRPASLILKKRVSDFPCAAAYQEALAKVASDLEVIRKIQGQSSRTVPHPGRDLAVEIKDGSSRRDLTPDRAPVQQPR